jgi:hypothetical protein
MRERFKGSDDQHHVLVVIYDELDDKPFHDPDPNGLAHRSQVAEWLSELRIKRASISFAASSTWRPRPRASALL